MALDLKILFGVITGLAIGWIIYFIQYKKMDEPERDERTEKIGCKAAKSYLWYFLL